MNLNDLVALNLNDLNANDLMIWSYISENKEKCMNYTIEQIANKCNVSRTTVLRFTQKLSLSGFSEFKVYLKMECTSQNKQSKNMQELIYNDMHGFIDYLKTANYDNIYDAIFKAKKIYVYGTGSVQHHIAKELKRLFLSAQIFIFEIEGSQEEIKVATAGITPDDLVFIVSLSGESPVAINFAQNLFIKNIPMVSITKFQSNRLASISAGNIFVNSLEVQVNSVKPYETTSLFFLAMENFLLKYFKYLEDKKIK